VVVFIALLVMLPLFAVDASAEELYPDYPAYLSDAPPEILVDPAGYPNRECESFVSWRTGWRITLSEWGWAPNWGNHAVYSTDPTPNSIAWYTNTPGGHVAWVDSVNPDGSCVIEEMNRDLNGQYMIEVISPGHNWPTGFLTGPYN
jgi:surface antigen